MSHSEDTHEEGQAPQWKDYIRILADRQNTIAAQGYGPPLGIGEVTQSAETETPASTSDSTTTSFGVGPRGQVLDIGASNNDSASAAHSDCSNSRDIANSGQTHANEVDQLIEYIENSPEFYVSVPGPAAQKSQQCQTVSSDFESTQDSIRIQPSHERLQPMADLGNRIRQVIKLQERRVSLFKELEKAFRKYVTEAEESSITNQQRYQATVQEVTQQMSEISNEVRSIAPEIESLDSPNIAKRIKELQQHEKHNLKSVIDMQVLRSELLVEQRFRNYDDEGISDRIKELEVQIAEREHFRQGILDEINEVMEELRIEMSEHVM